MRIFQDSVRKSLHRWGPATLLRHIPPKPSGEGCEAAGEIPRLLLFMALKTNVYIDGVEARGFRFPSTARLRSAMRPAFRGHHGQGLSRIRSSPCATKILKSWSNVAMRKPPPTATAAR